MFVARYNLLNWTQPLITADGTSSTNLSLYICLWHATYYWQTAQTCVGSWIAVFSALVRNSSSVEGSRPNLFYTIFFFYWLFFSAVIFVPEFYWVRQLTFVMEILTYSVLQQHLLIVPHIDIQLRAKDIWGSCNCRWKSTNQALMKKIILYYKMMEAQTSDTTICRSEGGMPCSAWKLTHEAVSCQTERGIPPEDRPIIVSEVWASIIDFCLHFNCAIKSQTISKWARLDAQNSLLNRP